MNEAQLRDRVRELADRTLPAKLRVFSDTSDFMNISAGDLILLGGRHYYVYGEEREGRFGIDEQPKLWVKRAWDLEAGERKVVKLAFFESFKMNLGEVAVECFRSPRKEARILEKVRGDASFMQGVAVEDDAGNVIRVLDRISGVSIFNQFREGGADHEAYFNGEFRRLFPSILKAFRGIRRLHEAGEIHGDIRNDHLWLERDTGHWRWIDFDYTYEWTENPFGVDLYGLGNVLLFTSGGGFYSVRTLYARLPGGLPDGAELEPGDFSLFLSHRIMNLRKLFPYVPESLNRVLMRFSGKVEVLYGSLGEMMEELEEAALEMGIEGR